MKQFAKGIVHMRYVLMVFFVFAAAVCGWAMTKVNTNYDIVSYLPQSSETVKGLDEMEAQFGAVGSAQLMVKMDATEVDALKTKLENVKGIQAVVASGTDEATYRDGYALFKLFLTSSSFSPGAHDTVNEIREAVAEYDDTAMNGGAVSSTFMQDAIVRDMIIIMIVACIVIMIILLLTSTSWIDPVVFALVVAVSLLINLGTNAILNQVSFITKAICAIMQLALAMDYSIILLHRFNEERERTVSIREAMVNAISGSFASVAASSLTTIAGLVALMFMKFTIGLDVGIVLTKGIVISLLSVFFFMPGVIMLFAPAIEKTKHRTLQQVFSEAAEKRHAKKQAQYDRVAAETGKPAKKTMTYVDFAFKARKVIPAVILVVLIVGAVMNFSVDYSYQLETSKNPNDPVNVEDQKIESVFGKQNSLAVLVPTGDLDKQRALVDFMLAYQYKGENVINSAQGMATYGFDAGIETEKLRSILETEDVDTILRLAGQPADAKKVRLYDLVKILANTNESGKANEEMEFSSGLIRRALLVAVNALDLVSKNPDYTAETLTAGLNQAFLPLTSKLTIDEKIVSIVYLAAGYEPAELVAVKDLLTAIEQKELLKLVFSGNESTAELLQSVLSAAIPMIDRIDTQMTAEEIGALLPLDGVTAKLKTLYTGFRKSTASVYEVLQMLAGVNPAGGRPILSADATGSIARSTLISSIAPTLRFAFKMFESEGGMSRVLFNLNMNTANDDSFAAVKEITEGVKQIYGDETVYVIGETGAYADIKDTFTVDSTTINLISFFAILLIVLISFRSLSVPVILTLLIQGATWVGMAMQFVAGSAVFFVCYLVVMCIQMGATVDYAILISNRYIENRYHMNRLDAMKNAFSASVMTVLTSGSILVIAAFIVGMVSKVAIIADLGVMLSIGCLVSIIIILIGLPAILFLGDKLIEKTTLKKKGQHFVADGETPAAVIADGAAPKDTEDQEFGEICSVRNREAIRDADVEIWEEDGEIREENGEEKLCGFDETAGDEQDSKK